MKFLSMTAALFGAITTGALAADKKPTWDVQTPHGVKFGELRKANFDTDEGTWLDVDVSPDGKSIAFSMLGDIYLLPIGGGAAKRLLGGPAFEVQPRFSPNGKELSFTSDRGGGDNIWRVKVDGSGLTQVTKESFRLLNNADWSPDGDFLVARKHFTSGRSLGAGEMWQYHRTGGSGLQLTKRKNDQQDAGQPAISPDGRYVYFSEDTSAGGFFQYNKDPHGSIYTVRRLDRESGEIVDLISVQGGAINPTPSPDGKQLAFVRRVRDKVVLHTLDLASGLITPIWDGLSHDMQEAWAIFGPYPNVAYTPDSKALVLWAKGKLWRVEIASKQATQIPFTANVSQTMEPPVRAEYRLDDGATFEAKMLRDAATSPEGNTVVFHAVGRLWKQLLSNGKPSGKPQALTGDKDYFEYSPSFAPDGRSVVYISYSDSSLAAVRSVDLTSGISTVLTATPGFYFNPRFSTDGKYLTFSKQAGGGLLDYRFSDHTGVYVALADGSNATRVAGSGAEPFFSTDGSRVLYLEGGGVSKKLMSAGVPGKAPATELAPRELFNLKYVDRVAPSPDGKFLAFTELYRAYVVALPSPLGGSSIELSRDTTSLPVTRLSQDIGAYLHWSGSKDALRLHWLEGKNYFSRDLRSVFSFVPNGSSESHTSAKSVALQLNAPLDRGNETIALINARVITMKGSEVLEKATVLVRGNRIVAVGSNVDVPADAKVIDASGKTILPGIVDVHAHANHFHNGPSPQANWSYYANLAFGITTMHDPSANTQEVFSQSELVKAGLNVGPRIMSTGTILYGADGDFKAEVNSLDDAREHLRRMKANGAFSVKSYNQPRRDQRQQINQAARELGMIVVMEGGSTFNHNLTMILDGSTGIEHNLPVAPLYRDVLKLWGSTDVRNTPTLVVNYGGLNGEYYWYERMNIWENERLLKFFPRETLDARSIRREKAPDWDYYHIEVAKAVKAASDAGVKIQIGGHGQLQGLAPHWEIWMLTQGGMSNHDALKAATINGADYLGFGRDLGSVEVGKMADLIVLEKNPLDDIQHTTSTALVMVNGRLFDAKTMAEIAGKQQAAPEFYWQKFAGVAAGQSQILGPTAICHCPKSHQHSPAH